MSETQTETTAQTEATSQDEGASFEGEFDADKAAKLIKALRAEKRTLQAKVAEATPKLTEYEQWKVAQQSESERQAAALADAESRLATAERAALRASVALAKGLPANLAARLQGDDQTSLEADADELLSLIPQDTTPRAPRVDHSQGSSANGGGALSPADQFGALIRQATGR